MYKLTKDPFGNDCQIIRIIDGVHFGKEPSNPDYQEYLKWLEEGNTPTPADEVQA